MSAFVNDNDSGELRGEVWVDMLKPVVAHSLEADKEEDPKYLMAWDLRLWPVSRVKKVRDKFLGGGVASQNKKPSTFNRSPSSQRKGADTQVVFYRLST